MDSQTLQTFAPYIIMALIFFIQNKIFVTPAQLLEKIAEVLAQIDAKYVTKTEMTALNDNVNDIKEKTDKIYDIIIQKYANEHREA